jgi:hypothetical protein
LQALPQRAEAVPPFSGAAFSFTRFLYRSNNL